VDLQNQFGACGVYIKRQWVQRYTGEYNDPRWRTDVINWLARMRQALHRLRHPLALIPNFSIDGLSASDPLMQQVVSHIDGIEDEEGFTRYGDWERLATKDSAHRECAEATETPTAVATKDRAKQRFLSRKAFFCTKMRQLSICLITA